MLAFVLIIAELVQAQNSTYPKQEASTIKISGSTKDSALRIAPGTKYSIADTKQHPDYISAMYYEIEFPQAGPPNYVTSESDPEIYVSNFYPGITSFSATSHDNSLIMFYISLDHNKDYYEYPMLQDTSFGIIV